MTKRSAARLSVVGLSVMCLSTAAGCGGEEKAKPSGPEIVVKDLSFRPAKVSVKAGNDVAWVFEDKETIHNVTAENGSFRSPDQAKGTFVHRFDAPGSVSYVCTIHPDRMKGTIDIRA